MHGGFKHIYQLLNMFTAYFHLCSISSVGQGGQELLFSLRCLRVVEREGSYQDRLSKLDRGEGKW